MTSLIFNVDPTSRNLLTSHLALIKFPTILVIICRLAHQNNNNYVSLLMAIYIYSADTKVDIITFLNHPGLFILYNVFLGKLKNITIFNTVFIKDQAFNRKLVGT